MNDIVLGVAGGIGAGKSEFVKRAAAALGASTASFGAYVRSVARSRGFAEDRDGLQSLGESLLAQLGTETFARKVLAECAERGSVIVDGVRHVEIADALRRLATPRQFVLVFLDVTDDIRRERLQPARPADAQRLGVLNNHSTELQVHDGSLKDRSDVVLDGTADPESVVRCLLEFLEKSSFS